jgi:hypothetical protein
VFEDEEVSFCSEDGIKFRASFGEKLMLHNAPEELKQKFRHAKNASNAQEAMELIKQHLNKGENFKEVLR